MQDAFKNARANRTIFKRTKPRQDLPELVLYVEALPGRSQRRVKDIEGNEHVLADKVMQSYYRILPGSQAKELGIQHWPIDTAEKRDDDDGDASDKA